ncbi:MRG/MORF4L-binding protein-like [Pseudomyrmex gracilis]|uniref:MRG/MORF4L-binding protein-like n=1 Tax=Pseudomyrmex gracilis TaxID=219809 RepID=UPI000995159E|nr:MRG/MORF4L-binding protein-like [Pseudomyrmex gracilis]
MYLSDIENLRKMAINDKEKQVDMSLHEVEWNVENEIQLFFAMNGHKPVGINKYFHMVCIWEKFRTAIHKNVPLKLIWNHLESMYDLVALDDVDLPFLNQEIDFSLPETEFMAKSHRKEESETKVKDQRDKHKEIKKEKDDKESLKKDSTFHDIKGSKDMGKEETKKYTREVETKKDKFKDMKDMTKEYKSFKGRFKSKDDLADNASDEKEHKDSESVYELLKRIPKRSTRQSMDNSKTSCSSDTPLSKRKRI